MNDDVLTIKDLAMLIRRYFWLIVLVVFGTTGVAVILAFVLPKSYECSTTFIIKAQYFNIPQVNNLMPTIASKEIRVQQNFLVRRAFDSDFIAEMGQQFHLFANTSKGPRLAQEVDELKRDFRIMQLEQSTFRLSFRDHDPQLAYDIISAGLNHIRDQLGSERIHLLENFRDAINVRLEEIQLKYKPKSGEANNNFVPASPRVSKMLVQLKRLESQKNFLLRTYTQRHPSVYKTEKTIRSLKKQIEAIKLEEKVIASDQSISTLAATSSEEMSAIDSEDFVRHNLLSRLAALNISISMEINGNQDYFKVIEKPYQPFQHIFPKKRWFIAGGGVFGIVLAIILVFLREYLRATAINAVFLAQKLNSKYFGILAVEANFKKQKQS